MPPLVAKRRAGSPFVRTHKVGRRIASHVLGSRLMAIDKQENKSMQPLKGIVMAMLAGTVMLAQEANTPGANKPLTGDPGVQADRPAAQTPPAQSKTSIATSDANSRNFTGT